MSLKTNTKHVFNYLLKTYHSVTSFIRQTYPEYRLFINKHNYRLLRFLKKVPRLNNIFQFSDDSRIPKFSSVKFEISVIYTLILGVILISFSSIFYIVTSRTLYTELDNELRIKAEGIVNSIQTFLDVKGEGEQTLAYAVEKTIGNEDKMQRRWWYIGFDRSWYGRLDQQDLSDEFINFIALDGSLSIQSKNMTDTFLNDFTQNQTLENSSPTYWNIDLKNDGLRVLNFPYPSVEKPTHLIQVGVSTGPVILLLKKWMTVVLLSIPIILLLTAFIGTLLASRILTPLQRIIDTANNISYGKLNLRVKPKIKYQELENLIGTFNDMISRLEKSFTHIDEFNTHVAHELKTPLTIIRGEAELSVLTSRSPETQNSLKTVIFEIDKMLKTIEDLLFISRTCYQPDAFKFSHIPFHPFLSEICDQFLYIAKDKNIIFEYTLPEQNLQVRADQLHLRRLFFNILDNAIKFTPANGKLLLTHSLNKDTISIHISDTGPGIAENILPNIFDQFFRDNTQHSGVGLGLSIAHAIAKAHGATITVSNNTDKGSTFSIHMSYVLNPKSSLNVTESII